MQSASFLIVLQSLCWDFLKPAIKKSSTFRLDSLHLTGIPIVFPGVQSSRSLFLNNSAFPHPPCFGINFCK